MLDNVEKIKCLGIAFTNDLKWNTHVSNICSKANRTLGFLRRNLAACPKAVKESAYKGLYYGVPLGSKVCIFSGTKNNFSATKNNISGTKNSFSGTKNNFSATKINFSGTKINFSPTNIIYSATKINFSPTKNTDF